MNLHFILCAHTHETKMKNKKALLCKAFLNFMAFALSFAVFPNLTGLILRRFFFKEALSWRTLSAVGIAFSVGGR